MRKKNADRDIKTCRNQRLEAAFDTGSSSWILPPYCDVGRRHRS